MNPMTMAAESFMKQGLAQFHQQRHHAVRFVCEHGYRREMIKALRLWEYSRDNRHAFFLYDHQYRDRNQYFDELSNAIRNDYEQIRKGVADEGVEIMAFDLEDRENVAALSPIERAIVVAERAAALLGKRLDGIVLGLLPHHIHDTASWRNSVTTLVTAPWSKRVRLGFFDPPGGPLEQVLGDHAASFSVDTDLLFDFLKQIVTNKSSGPSGPPNPALTEDQRREHEARTGQKVLSEDDAHALRSALLDAGHHMAKSRHIEAAEAFNRALRLCQQFNLHLEEATVLVGMGGLAMSTQALDEALDCYRRAAEIGEEKGQWQIVAQARLAMGSALVMQKQYLHAVHAYEVCAGAAQKAGLPALRLEALRMAGTCHVSRGAQDEAIPFWQLAITEGTALDPETRRASTFREVAAQFVALLERSGLRPQADHVRAMAEMPGKE